MPSLVRSPSARPPATAVADRPIPVGLHVLVGFAERALVDYCVSLGKKAKDAASLAATLEGQGLPPGSSTRQFAADLLARLPRGGGVGSAAAAAAAAQKAREAEAAAFARKQATYGLLLPDDEEERAAEAAARQQQEAQRARDAAQQDGGGGGKKAHLRKSRAELDGDEDTVVKKKGRKRAWEEEDGEGELLAAVCISRHGQLGWDAVPTAPATVTGAQFCSLAAGALAAAAVAQVHRLRSRVLLAAEDPAVAEERRKAEARERDRQEKEEFEQRLKEKDEVRCWGVPGTAAAEAPALSLACCCGCMPVVACAQSRRCSFAMAAFHLVPPCAAGSHCRLARGAWPRSGSPRRSWRRWSGGGGQRRRRTGRGW